MWVKGRLSVAYIKRILLPVMSALFDFHPSTISRVSTRICIEAWKVKRGASSSFPPILVGWTCIYVCVSVVFQEGGKPSYRWGFFFSREKEGERKKKYQVWIRKYWEQKQCPRSTPYISYSTYCTPKMQALPSIHSFIRASVWISIFPLILTQYCSGSNWASVVDTERGWKICTISLYSGLSL